MGVKLAAALGGSVELVPTNTASNYTATMPAKTGTVAMDGPAFSAYNSSNTSLISNTYTKVGFQTEEFDTNNNFDTSNFRFTPTVAGYYQFNAAVVMSAATAQIILTFYKNGSLFKNAPNYPAAGSSVSSGVSGSTLMYLNGSTDYVEVYVFQTAGTQNAQTGAAYTWFQGCLVRGA